MGLSDIKFIKQDGALGGVLANEDHISALVFLYSYDTTPIVISYPIGEITDIKDAESKGITIDDYPLEHYHISEFFRMNENARLFVGYEVAHNAAYVFDVLSDLQNEADGKIRQFGIIDKKPFSAPLLDTIQAKLVSLETEHKPSIAVYGCDMSEMTLAALIDLRTKSDSRVSVLISQSASGIGAELVESLGISIPAIGNLVGIISKAAVHENIGWIEKFQADGNNELVEVDFCTGDEYKSVAESTLTALNDKGYIFLRHHIGIAGTYYNDTPTATAITSDYCYIERNRTIDKAIRGMRIYLLPKLNSPLKLDATTGKLDLVTIKYFENLAGKALDQMQKDGEISGFKVYINPNQDILTTSQLLVTVQIVIMGVARTITVSVAFAKSV